MRDANRYSTGGGNGSEQQAYARLLGWSSSGGLALLVIAFLLYVTEFMPPLIDVVRLPHVWTLSAREISANEGHPAGWDWLWLLHHGDIFNLLGIAVLATCSIVPLVAVAIIYWQGRERVFALLAAMQVLVLLLAASGLVSIGH